MNKLFSVVFAVVAMIVGFMTFQHLTEKPQPKHALYYQQARVLKPFQLTDHNGDVFSKAQLSGKWSFVFLGYTSCPDVCPMTLQKLSFSYPKLKTIAPNSQVLLVTADPKRDSQAKLSQYIAYFDAEFIALRAEHDVLFPFTRNLGLMYAISGDDENYLVDHSASLVLINPDGDVSAIFKPAQAVGKVPSIDTDKLLSDYEKIVALY